MILVQLQFLTQLYAACYTPHSSKYQELNWGGNDVLNLSDEEQ